MLKKWMYIFVSILMMLALFIQAIDWMAFDNNFYEKQYLSLDVAQSIQISDDELMKVTSYLLGYIKDEYNDLKVMAIIDGEQREFFNEREIDHMMDVKILYQQVMLFKNMVYVSFFMMILYVFYKKEHRVYGRAALSAMMYLGIILGVLIFMSVLDFDQVWRAFHQVFFRNDLWLLDPATDLLIRMVPLAFFNALVFKITTLYIIMLGIFGCLAYKMKGI